MKKVPSKNAPVLPPPPMRLVPHSLASIFGARGPSSTLHFLVHPGMQELQREAANRGWHEKGWTTLSVAWMELHWTRDGWKTTNVLSSNDVPCPVMNGTFHLGNCAPGTDVEFAIRVGLAAHAPHDTAGARDVGEVWLNNDGKNFTQTSAD
ncbi:MAG: hypothetical protein ACO1OB_34145 [Archangium sp.]